MPEKVICLVLGNREHRILTIIADGITNLEKIRDQFTDTPYKNYSCLCNSLIRLVEKRIITPIHHTLRELIHFRHRLDLKERELAAMNYDFALTRRGELLLEYFEIGGK